MEKAIFCGGCFWCIEAVFKRIDGVNNIVSGYTGGFVKNPSYREVCKGITGHAEGVIIDFDSNVVSYKDLLEVFFAAHNPTTLNRQGNDIGTQYRSAIYYKNENNMKIILASKEQYQKELNKKNFGFIETEIKMIDIYFFAEQYHQQYLASAGSRQYCSASPTKVKLGVFTGSNYKLKNHIWENFNWEVDKCVLRSDNNPIKNNI